MRGRNLRHPGRTEDDKGKADRAGCHDRQSHRLAFLDIEASGLDGCPIEIGWAIADIALRTVATRSLLIRPPASWHITKRWDEAAEALHGLTIETLLREGETPDAILAVMNAELAGRTLATDAPAWDMAWFAQLVDASAHQPAFVITPQNALTLIGDAARAQGWSPEAFAAVISGLDATNPHAHRAEPDTARLAALWLAAHQTPPQGQTESPNSIEDRHAPDD